MANNDNEKNWIEKLIGSGGWKIAHILLGILIIGATAAYNDIKSDISGVGVKVENVETEVKGDIKDVREDIDGIKTQVGDLDKRLAIRDQVASMILERINDLELRVRELERK